ncbi:M23 family metallopeptidase [Chryseolinea lacunae]|uniref:M23 family metallopeptidase n=1 Tax=Chryseolinea lacunae TaxID=2801331 RepID=A0ABS1L006_9BACT|nr:M23 family metallopeptidase [Chryseolinea lacunae]MBL0744837.1 M23 family metallopeptidase [Chryseolinea lacunae]
MTKYQTRLASISLLLLIESCTRIADVAPIRLDEKNLTQQFEALKGTMRPLDGYDETFVSQNQKPTTLISYACVEWDCQIYRYTKHCNVKSVSAGTVKKIIKSDRGTWAILRHGRYMTVYGRMDSVIVKEGVHMETGAVIGRASPFESPFNFKIFDTEKGQINPSEWIEP